METYGTLRVNSSPTYIHKYQILWMHIKIQRVLNKQQRDFLE